MPLVKTVDEMILSLPKAGFCHGNRISNDNGLLKAKGRKPGVLFFRRKIAIRSEERMTNCPD